MRRTDREITAFPELIAILKKCDVCRLAFHDEPYPYILPLNFGMTVDGTQLTLYFHGATEGKKYDLMAKNSLVSFEADCSHQLIINEQACSCTMAYESVIGQGKVEIVSDEEKLDALIEIMRHYHREDFAFNRDVIPHTTVFKLVVTAMTGKRRNAK
ncbi:pyridoxamine 5'-phosphate oxidase family protein [uncultured Ruminococcus sp.]|uniref:pyridoxamine 5'-phosphate oxidase family protein n=1 Tax=uncultured Ruminococcus sp. TaxID=165186 RepID=UPI002623AA13|nr:pyridoxamine 5'-phosphate oxidase family protein [uncultured Ruminococcus sp.]